MKLLITCGGTGGHFYPGLAIAIEAKGQGMDSVIALSGKSTDKFKKVSEEQGIKSHILTRFSRSVKRWQQPLLMLRVIKDIASCWRLLGKEKPDAVLGMGSFASFGMCFAAVLRRVPLFLHEGNSVVGSSNRFLSRYAHKLFLSFQAVNSGQVKCDSVLTGFPVRQVFIDAAQQNLDRAEACGKIGCDAGKMVLLVFGGSQGAQSLNSAVLNTLSDFADKEQLQVFHIAGNREEVQRLTSGYEKAGVDAVVRDYVKDMNSCYRVADAAIARAGAASLFELALFKVPTMAVPLPWAADNHQMKNAEAVNLVAGKDVVAICPQSKLEDDSAAFIQKMFTDLEALRSSGDALSKILDGTKAAVNVVAGIKNYLRGK